MLKMKTLYINLVNHNLCKFKISIFKMNLICKNKNKNINFFKVAKEI